MSDTAKDKKPIYRTEAEIVPLRKREPVLKRRYLNFKRYGPPLDGDICPECGGLTDLRNGYLICSECGWTEDIVEMFQLKGLAA